LVTFIRPRSSASNQIVSAIQKITREEIKYDADETYLNEKINIQSINKE
jgi:hypothetical protein